MKIKKKDPKILERRIKKLQKMGFTIISNEYVSLSIDYVHTIEIDFSGIAEDKFFEHTVKQIYKSGVAKGKEDVRKEIKKSLGIKPTF
jgi:hypothetical protein